MKKKTIWTRALALVLMVLMLAAVLVSCGGAAAPTVDSHWTTNDENQVIYFSRILSQDAAAAAREQFIAASRGYTKDQMSDATIDPGTEGTADRLAAAKIALDQIKPSDDASLAKYNEFLLALSEQDVQTIASRIRENTVIKNDVNNGIWDTILVWIGQFLRILTFVTGGNYIWALFFFALVIEIILLFAFGIRQQKNSQKQARLRPKEMAIRRKYAGRNDQRTMQKMNEEIQKLYQEEGFNPMGGCLPLLIQMPILIALYNIVVDPLRYVLGLSSTLSSAFTTFCTASRAAGGLGIAATGSRGTIELLSQFHEKGGSIELLQKFPLFNMETECLELVGKATTDIPNFYLFGTNMGQIPGFHAPWGLLLIPVLTFVLYFFSMKLNRKFSFQPAVQQDQQMGCSNSMMDLMMPAMSVYITFIVPAAVGIYWMFKCIITTIKQFALHKLMPLPECTEEMIKAAEKEMKGKGKPDKRTGGTRTTTDGREVRSLHYIDDEDEDLPPRTTDPVDRYDDDDEEEECAPTEPSESTTTAPSAVERAPIKEDRKNNKNKKK